MDRYSLLAVAIIIVIVSISMFDQSVDGKESMIGFADDVNEKDNGFIFFINDCDGNRMKAYCDQRPDDDLHSFIGRYSDDRNIFFVSDIISC